MIFGNSSSSPSGSTFVVLTAAAATAAAIAATTVMSSSNNGGNSSNSTWSLSLSSTSRHRQRRRNRNRNRNGNRSEQSEQEEEDVIRTRTNDEDNMEEQSETTKNRSRAATVPTNKTIITTATFQESVQKALQILQLTATEALGATQDVASGVIRVRRSRKPSSSYGSTSSTNTSSLSFSLSLPIELPSTMLNSSHLFIWQHFQRSVYYTKERLQLAKYTALTWNANDAKTKKKNGKSSTDIVDAIVRSFLIGRWETPVNAQTRDDDAPRSKLLDIPTSMTSTPSTPSVPVPSRREPCFQTTGTSETIDNVSNTETDMSWKSNATAVDASSETETEDDQVQEKATAPLETAETISITPRNLPRSLCALTSSSPKPNSDTTDIRGNVSIDDVTKEPIPQPLTDTAIQDLDLQGRSSSPSPSPTTIGIPTDSVVATMTTTNVDNKIDSIPLSQDSSATVVETHINTAQSADQMQSIPPKTSTTFENAIAVTPDKCLPQPNVSVNDRQDVNEELTKQVEHQEGIILSTSKVDDTTPSPISSKVPPVSSKEERIDATDESTAHPVPTVRQSRSLALDCPEKIHSSVVVPGANIATISTTPVAVVAQVHGAVPSSTDERFERDAAVGVTPIEVSPEINADNDNCAHMKDQEVVAVTDPPLGKQESLMDVQHITGVTKNNLDLSSNSLTDAGHNKVAFDSSSVDQTRNLPVMPAPDPKEEWNNSSDIRHRIPVDQIRTVPIVSSQAHADEYMGLILGQHKDQHHHTQVSMDAGFESSGMSEMHDRRRHSTNDKRKQKKKKKARGLLPMALYEYDQAQRYSVSADSPQRSRRLRQQRGHVPSHITAHRGLDVAVGDNNERSEPQLPRYQGDNHPHTKDAPQSNSASQTRNITVNEPETPTRSSFTATANDDVALGATPVTTPTRTGPSAEAMGAVTTNATSADKESVTLTPTAAAQESTSIVAPTAVATVSPLTASNDKDDASSTAAETCSTMEQSFLGAVGASSSITPSKLGSPPATITTTTTATTKHSQSKRRRRPPRRRIFSNRVASSYLSPSSTS